MYYDLKNISRCIFWHKAFEALSRSLLLANIANIARLRMHVECTHLSHHNDKNETSLQIKVIFGHCCSFETMLFRMLLVELWKYCSNVFSHPGSVWLWGTRITCNRETRYVVSFIRNVPQIAIWRDVVNAAFYKIYISSTTESVIGRAM